MARSRPLWVVVGAVYGGLAVATYLVLLTEPVPTHRAQILSVLLTAAAASHLLSRPPAIGTVRNHLTVAASYVCAGWALFALQPGGSVAIGGLMFVAPFIAIRLVDRRDIAAHLVATNVVLFGVAGSGVFAGLVDATTVIACLLGTAGTTVQCFTCAVMLAAAEQQSNELEVLTRLDGLTGVGNRRLYEERLEERVALHAETGQGFSLAMVDVNDFKAINDGAGHQAGDEVLQIVAARLGGVLGDGETLVRMGGDEFCLLLAEDGTADAGVERVREALVSIRYNEFLVTAGVGVAVWPDEARDAAALQLLADARLRTDKHRPTTGDVPAPPTEEATDDADHPPGDDPGRR